MDLRELITESYSKFRGQNLARFWQDVVSDTDIVHLSEEDLLAHQEDFNAALDSFWTRLPPSSKRVGQLQLERTVPDEPDETILDDESEHFFARPSLACKRRMESDGMDLDATEEEEDESQCSVGLYENGGTGPPSASASQSEEPLAAPTECVDRTRSPKCEPTNFSNCFAKQNDLQGEQVTIAHPPAVELELNGELVESAAAVETTDMKDEVEGLTSDTTVATTGAPGTTDATGEGTTPGVEKKMIPVRNRLPVAVLKPDNPRAVRYWLDQRRTARSFPTEQAEDSNKMSGVGKAVEDFLAKGKLEPEDWELFHLGRDLGVHDALGQRILQVCPPSLSHLVYK